MRFTLASCGAVIGTGKYSESTHKKIYAAWFNMLSRCYDEQMLLTHPSYKVRGVAYVFNGWIFKSSQNGTNINKLLMVGM